MNWLSGVVVVLFVVLLLLVAWNDFASRLIPDCLPDGVALIGGAMGLTTGPAAFGISLAIALGVFVAFLFLHARGILGGGDVKLMVVICLGLSPFAICRFVLVTELTGGAVNIVHLILRRFAVQLRTRGTGPAHRAPLQSRATRERWRIAREGWLSYGVAIACGAIWAVIENRGY